MKNSSQEAIPAENEGFLRIWRGPRLRYLYSEKPNAMILLLLIMDRARYSDGWNPHGLKKFQCLLGRDDVAATIHFTEQEYRTAKRDLEEAGAATFKATSKGTIATLCNTVACIYTGKENNERNNEQSNEPPTNPQRTPNEPLTTNKEGIERIEREEGYTGEGEGSGGLSDLESLRMEVLATGKVREKQLSMEAWKMIIRNCPGFDCGKMQHRDQLLVMLMTSKDDVIGEPSYWFGRRLADIINPAKAQGYGQNFGETSGPRGNFVGAYQ